MAGKLYILSAPSGAGKSTLAKALRDRVPNLGVSVSHTTRAPRPGEQDGVHYHFVDRARFQEMAAAGAFVEHAQVFDNYYGTSHTAIASLLEAGQDVLLDIDWQGARNIKSRMPGAVSIFVLPPSLQALEQRLRGRAQDSEDVIARRMRAARAEISHYDEFDYVIVNDDFDQALADLLAIIAGRNAAVRPLNVDVQDLLASP